MLGCDVFKVKAKRKISNTDLIMMTAHAGVTGPTLHCLVEIGTRGTYTNADVLATVVAASNKSPLSLS